MWETKKVLKFGKFWKFPQSGTRGFTFENCCLFWKKKTWQEWIGKDIYNETELITKPNLLITLMIPQSEQVRRKYGTVATEYRAWSAGSAKIIKTWLRFENLLGES